MRRHTWPTDQSPADRVGVVMVSYNTLAVSAQTVYAVSRTAPARLVVVDNASTDGYAELFTALADAGLCEMIANREQRYHGPALPQALDHPVRHPVRRPAGRARAGQVASTWTSPS